MIKCGRCKEDKAPEDFCNNSKRKNGKQFNCKSCQAELNLQRYHKKLSGCSSHREKKREYDLKRRKEKREQLRAYDRERSKSPHRKAAHNEDTRKRRAKLKQAVPQDYDREGVLAMYKLSQKISKLTGVEMHVDHIVPIACGGKHNIKNLQLLAGTLNLAKGTNPHFELSWNSYPAE